MLLFDKCRARFASRLVVGFVCLKTFLGFKLVGMPRVESSHENDLHYSANHGVTTYEEAQDKAVCTKIGNLRQLIDYCNYHFVGVSSLRDGVLLEGGVEGLPECRATALRRFKEGTQGRIRWLTGCMQNALTPVRFVNRLQECGPSGDRHDQNLRASVLHHGHPCLNIFDPGEAIVIVDVVQEEPHLHTHFSSQRSFSAPVCSRAHLSCHRTYFIR
jgi:hypothetical protein